MLRPPYSRYNRIYLYILGTSVLPHLNDPDYIGGWVDDATVMLLFHQPKEADIARLCSQHDCSVIYQADMLYDDWENGTAIEPFTVEGVTVAPLWYAHKADISLDPSVIFGNGFHPTTRLCLESMLQLLGQQRKPVVSGLDLGCGTGLLALAAAHMGMCKVRAVDNNPFACQVAQANVIRNNFGNQVVVAEVDLTDDCPDTRVDLVTANLHPELLQRLFEQPTFWQARWYVLSGFFIHQEEKLLCSLPTDTIRFLHRQSREKWAVWVLEKEENESSAGEESMKL